MGQSSVSCICGILDSLTQNLWKACGKWLHQSRNLSHEPSSRSVLSTPPLQALSEVFLPVVELVLVALLLEDLPELGRAAEEDGDPPLLLLVDRLEDLVPVGATRVGPRLQARDQVALRLQKKTGG